MRVRGQAVLLSAKKVCAKLDAQGLSNVNRRVVAALCNGAEIVDVA